MRHRNTELLLGYWTKLKGERPIPARADIDPRAIKRILPDLFILDRHARNRMTFTLAGTRLCWLFGRELRELNFLSMWTGSSERQVRETLEAALTSLSPAVIYAIAETHDHRTLRTEILALPIADSRGGVTRLLGSFTPLDPVMALGERKLTNQWVVSADLIRNPAMAAGVDFDQNGPQPPAQGPRPPGRVPYLRLVVSREDKSAPGHNSPLIADEGLAGLMGTQPSPSV
ncbi:MAG: PAS domain-containing protein [Alphaproteobacteria bacterium]|nr:PAS domain-containing protein [Alphaproteobacteria bacterium]